MFQLLFKSLWNKEDTDSILIHLWFNRVEVIRQPTGPDGTKGFTQPRVLLYNSHTSDKLQNGTSTEEGSVFEDLVAQIFDQD